MAYATTDELAAALRITRVTPEMIPVLQKCLDAAASEIDHYVDRFPDAPALDGDALVNRVNVLRGVEWWKANDAAFGVIGFDQVGPVRAPRDSFARHGSALVPVKQQWGIA